LDQKPEDILDRLEDNLEFYQQLGMGFVMAPPAESAQSPESEIPPVSDGEALSSLEKEILSCKKCRLSETRTQAVPGEGNRQAALMFVGEGPGRDEDRMGRPFVGRAGQLLTKIIKAMEFERSEVYITNVVKCRPPQNRNPLDDEVESCKAFLLDQIRIINPAVIVTLGKVAADFFVPGSPTMGSIRGKFHLYGDIPVMPTYHPAYLIRNERNRDLKRKVWEDMKQVMSLLSKK
jgi:uracil-DNA glycosylase family 4